MGGKVDRGEEKVVGRRKRCEVNSYEMKVLKEKRFLRKGKELKRWEKWEKKKG